jgi:hypothetical protein
MEQHLPRSSADAEFFRQALPPRSPHKMNKLFQFENGASAYGRSPGDSASQPLTSKVRRSGPRVSLGLKTCQLIIVLLTVAVPLTLAYDFALGQVATHEAAYRRVISLRPGYFEAQPMTREWAKKSIQAVAYTRHWYQCLGEGAVTVFMWTLL